MAGKQAPLYLVDASIYVFRAWFSIPDTFYSKAGQSINAVYGYAGFLLDLLTHQPELASVAFDESLVSCFRNRIYPEYKANRELPDENLKYQFEQCQRITGLLGFHNLSLEEYEADDIIGTLMAKFGKGRPTIIVTRDKDLGQLLGSRDSLWDFAADTRSGRKEVEAKFGVPPELLPDLLALAGDTVDNIPGAPGIGAKTAARLLVEFGSLEKLLADPEAVAGSPIRGSARLRDIPVEHGERVKLYRRITPIKCDVPMKVRQKDLAITPADRASLDEFCDEMQFGRRLRERIARLEL